MTKLLTFLKKNKVAQAVLGACRSAYFFSYKYFVKKFKFNILGPEESLNRIKKYNLSVGRFGDGELNLIFRGKDIGFQKYSPEIRIDLIESLKKFEEKRIEFALPHGFKNTSNDKFFLKTFWWSYVTRNNNKIEEFHQLSNMSTFLDASFTRVITELVDKKEINNINLKIKSLWTKKDVLVVEGAGTKFGLGNNLLNNAQKVSRIIAPATNAYEKIDEIRTTVKNFVDNNPSPNRIILIALGPTATILSAEFSHYAQTIDIGHFDLQYEYIQKGKYKRIDVPEKYDNESINGEYYNETGDDAFNNEVVSVIN